MTQQIPILHRLLQEYRHWVSREEEKDRLIDLGGRILAERRHPRTLEERRAVEAYLEWEEQAW